MIKIVNVSKAYRGKYVLENVNVVLPKGKVISFIGANGAGKSTLLSIISRLAHGEGDVFLDEKPLRQYDTTEFSRKLAILTQSNTLNVRLTVRELVSFGRYPHTKARLSEKDRNIVEEAIGCMELESFSNRYIDELSGGERQRALIAMIIAQDTEYVLLDEPLNNLDMKHSVSVMKLLRHLARERGKTIILVIHDINFASCYSDHIVALKNGRLFRAGPIREVMTHQTLRDIFDMEFDIREIGGNPVCLYYT